MVCYYLHVSMVRYIDLLFLVFFLSVCVLCAYVLLLWTFV